MRRWLPTATLLLALLVPLSASADSARCTAIDADPNAICACEETLDTNTYTVVGCGSSSGGVCDVDPTGEGGTRQCSQSFGNSLQITGLGSTPLSSLSSNLVPTVETDLPNGNTVTRVWRLARADRALTMFGDDLQTSTRRVCQRHYMHFSPNHDGGPTINCSNGKFIHMGFINSPAYQVGMSNGGDHGPTSNVIVVGLGPWGSGASIPSTGSLTSGDCYAPNWCRVEQCIGGNFETGSGDFFVEANAVQITGSKRKDWPRYNIGAGPGTPLTNPNQVWALIDGYAGYANELNNCNPGHFAVERTNEWREYSYAMQAEWTTDTEGTFIGAASEIEGGGGDTTAPTVVLSSPLNGATNVPVNSNASVNFSEAMNPTTITSSTVKLLDGVNPVTATLSYAGTTALLDPTTDLTANHAYAIKVVSGASGVKDLAGNQLAADFDATFTTASASAGTLAFTAATFSEPEGTSTTRFLAVVVSRTSGNSGPVSVTVTPSGGTATATTDYNASPIVLSWVDGEIVTKTALFQLVPDASDEANETFNVALGSPTGGAALGAQSTAVATILDDDDAALPTVTISRDPASIAENDSSVGIFTVTLSATSPQVCDVFISFGGTALSAGLGGSDYWASYFMFSVPVGQTTATLEVHGMSDAVSDNNETIVISIDSTSSNCAENGAQSASMTIVETAAPPAVNLTVNSPIAEGGTATFTATLDPAVGIGTDVIVGYTLSGTTTAGFGFDYLVPTIPFEITIPAGLTTGTLGINSEVDSVDEDTETLTMTLISATSNAVLGSTLTATTNFSDDDATPTVTLTTNDANLAEAADDATIDVALSAASGRTVTVTFTYSGTATNNTDYTRSTESIVIAAGLPGGTATVAAVQDLVDDDAETAVIDITGCTNCTEAVPQTVTETITDDDVTTVIQCP